jgi:NADPH:quinone reductase-like Zn-dependent oxidoreductase
MLLKYKSRLVEEFSKLALPMFETGKLVPIVHKVFPLEQIKDAHRMMESGDNIGKIVLRVVQNDEAVSSKSEL